jgi:hypothetical protein
VLKALVSPAIQYHGLFFEAGVTRRGERLGVASETLFTDTLSEWQKKIRMAHSVWNQTRGTSTPTPSAREASANRASPIPRQPALEESNMSLSMARTNVIPSAKEQTAFQMIASDFKA